MAAGMIMMAQRTPTPARVKWPLMLLLTARQWDTGWGKIFTAENKKAVYWLSECGGSRRTRGCIMFLGHVGAAANKVFVMG
jgi:hypothetical protein